MTEKFIEKIKKLKNYYILHAENNAILMGTEITINKHRELLGNIFQPQGEVSIKTFYISFLIALEENNKEIKEYKNKKIPILTLSPKTQTLNPQIIESKINEFVQELQDGGQVIPYI